MKKKITLFILITFTIVCFSGCSKEENTQTEVNALEVNRTSTYISNISLNTLSNDIVSNSIYNEISPPNTSDKKEEILARFFYQNIFFRFCKTKKFRNNF